jgi:hypothetical protein
MVGPVRRPFVMYKTDAVEGRTRKNGAAAVHRIVIVIIRAHAPFSLPKIEPTLQVSNQLTAHMPIDYYLRGHGPTVTLAAAAAGGGGCTLRSAAVPTNHRNMRRCSIFGRAGVNQCPLRTHAGAALGAWTLLVAQASNREEGSGHTATRTRPLVVVSPVTKMCPSQSARGWSTTKHHCGTRCSSRQGFSLRHLAQALGTARGDVRTTKQDQ